MSSKELVVIRTRSRLGVARGVGEVDDDALQQAWVGGAPQGTRVERELDSSGPAELIERGDDDVGGSTWEGDGEHARLQRLTSSRSVTRTEARRGFRRRRDELVVSAALRRLRRRRPPTAAMAAASGRRRSWLTADSSAVRTWSVAASGAMPLAVSVSSLCSRAAASWAVTTVEEALFAGADIGPCSSRWRGASAAADSRYRPSAHRLAVGRQHLCPLRRRRTPPRRTLRGCAPRAPGRRSAAQHAAGDRRRARIRRRACERGASTCGGRRSSSPGSR
jgi:hypothetical protein